MRSAEQIGRTVEEWRDYKAAERQRSLREHLAHMERVRVERPEWYAWATEGQPVLTAAQYERVQNRGARASRREQRQP